MVKVCKMHFLQGMSQQEISAQLYISRSQVSKLLTKAKRSNVFSVQINDPFCEEDRAARQLVERFGVDHAVVVDTRGASDPLRVLARSLSRLATSVLSHGDVVGVSAGYTVAACSAHTNLYNCHDLLFVPLVAGQSYEGASWYANDNCQRFSERHPSKYMVLNVPQIVRNRAVREELEANDGVRPVLDQYAQLGAMLLGIGEASPESTLAKCAVSREEIQEALSRGVKAVIGASFIDADGKEVFDERTDFFIGIRAEQIRKCPCVIGVAMGLNKVEAIRATLVGGYLNTLCTDLNTARALLAT